MPVRAFMNAVAEEGFGHHWMLGYANVMEPLARFCALTGIRGVFPGS
jgi:hypothetical protein